jgi:hypothetical protein
LLEGRDTEEKQQSIDRGRNKGAGMRREKVERKRLRKKTRSAAEGTRQKGRQRVERQRERYIGVGTGKEE